jgi:MerR family transcriptional regulator/heat shock protein HspR
LYEREGLIKPSRTEGNTRLYSDEDLAELETILALTRDLGVNLAGVEIILNMRRKMERMQTEVNEFMEYVKHELARGLGDWEQRLNTALVPTAPSELVNADTAVTASGVKRPRTGLLPFPLLLPEAAGAGLPMASNVMVWPLPASLTETLPSVGPLIALVTTCPLGTPHHRR